MAHKVVLITGGSSGIGKAIGIFLKSKGFKVYGTTRNKSKYLDFDHFELLEIDVRNNETIAIAITKLVALEGGIDVLINNAGVGITGPVEETPHEEIVRAFDTNFYGPIRMVKAVLPQMRKQKSGLVINITSIAGYMGLPYRGIYSATKGALELVTEALSMEVKDFGVHITNIAPGDFVTNIASGRYHVPIVNDSAYKVPYAKTLEAINNDVHSGGDPIDVAKLVLRIINTRKPKIHYKVGDSMQKFSLFLKKVLPDKVYEKLLLNHYKL